MKTIYYVAHDGLTTKSEPGSYGGYATRSVAEAAAEAIRERRVPERYWYRNPRVEEMEMIGDHFQPAEYASFVDSNLDYLVVDPDGKYPWPEKLDADGWRRAAPAA